MRTTLCIRGIELGCAIGINPGEQDQAQPVRIDLTVEVDPATSFVADRPSIDYTEVAETVRDVVTGRCWGLVEELAWSCVHAIRARFPAAGGMTLRVTKPRALPGSAEAAVEVVLAAGEEPPTI